MERIWYAGRLIDQRDTPNSRGVTVVTQNFAKKFFPKDDAIGKRFGMDNPGDYEIVGIVEDAKYLDRSGYAVADLLPAAAADDKSALGFTRPGALEHHSRHRTASGGQRQGPGANNSQRHRRNRSESFRTQSPELLPTRSAEISTRSGCWRG